MLLQVAAAYCVDKVDLSTSILLTSGGKLFGTTHREKLQHASTQDPAQPKDTITISYHVFLGGLFKVQEGRVPPAQIQTSADVVRQASNGLKE